MRKFFKAVFYTPRDAVVANLALMEIVNTIPVNEFTPPGQPTGHKTRLSYRYWETKFRVLKLLREATYAAYHGQAARLQYLSKQYEERYDQNHSVADLDKAIRLLRLAVDITPKERDTDLRDYLHELGNLFAYKYFETTALSDIDEAVRLLQEAVELTANENGEERGRVLHDLAKRLGQRYDRTNSLSDLNEVLQAAREASALTSEENKVQLAACLNTLGLALRARYSKLGDEADLEEGKKVLWKAIDQSEEDYTVQANTYNTLACLFSTRYDKTSDLVDLEEAIQLTKKAVDITPFEDAPHATWSSNLADLLHEKYQATGSTDDLDHAVINYHHALCQWMSPIGERVEAGLKALQACRLTMNWDQAREISETSIGLIQKLTPRSLEIEDKQYVLGRVAGIVSEAVAVALQTDQGPFVALNILERGRGVIAASILEMRSDLTDLQEHYPQLAEQFVRLRDDMELPSVANRVGGIIRHKKKPWRLPAQERFDMATKLNEVIDEIRQKPGFGAFLLQPTAEDMQAAAECGPIVVINVNDFRSDAILIEQHQIRSLPLPRMNTAEIEAQIRTAQGFEVLVWLWDVLANPILTSLGINHAPSNAEELPRVWWIPTGPLSRLPLHAAGRHMDRSGETVLDRVVSSYSSSVRAIINCRRWPVAAPTAQDEAVLLGMSHTPGLGQLYFAANEVAEVRKTCKMLSLNVVEPQSKKRDVMLSLKTCKIFHFAGHGYTDTSDPLQSYLVLEDWRKHRLAVADLLQIDLRRSQPFLAYLSACGTAQIEDNEHLDESMHLISAFQLAGFRHIIGTLWQVNDRCCADLARITYEAIGAQGITDDSVCRGLHKATRALRDNWVPELNGKMAEGGFNDRGGRTRAGLAGGGGENDDLPERDIELVEEDDNRTGLVPWVPYVHYGV
ncbi:hypothetical protein HD806DRAFT_494139 [Xylariaceae sp. AK1471]|nr:hypothetical protein HD806DRAFT_494139 [Xylariaceae sp. AK1471]